MGEDLNQNAGTRFANALLELGTSELPLLPQKLQAILSIWSPEIDQEISQKSDASDFYVAIGKLIGKLELLDHLSENYLQDLQEVLKQLDILYAGEVSSIKAFQVVFKKSRLAPSGTYKPDAEKSENWYTENKEQFFFRRSNIVDFGRLWSEQSGKFDNAPQDVRSLPMGKEGNSRIGGDQESEQADLDYSDEYQNIISDSCDMLAAADRQTVLKAVDAMSPHQKIEFSMRCAEVIAAIESMAPKISDRAFSELSFDRRKLIVDAFNRASRKIYKGLVFGENKETQDFFNRWLDDSFSLRDKDLSSDQKLLMVNAIHFYKNEFGGKIELFHKGKWLEVRVDAQKHGKGRRFRVREVGESGDVISAAIGFPKLRFSEI